MKTWFVKYTPYLYFISVLAFWFTRINRDEGIVGFLLLIPILPFIWQLIKPSKQLNFALGISALCISSYLIIAFLVDALKLTSISPRTKETLFYGGLLVAANFLMAMWMIRNSLKNMV